MLGIPVHDEAWRRRSISREHNRHHRGPVAEGTPNGCGGDRVCCGSRSFGGTAARCHAPEGKGGVVLGYHGVLSRIG